MCAVCSVTELARAGDWKEVARLAREQDKTEKAEEKAEEKAAEPKKATASRASKSD